MIFAMEERFEVTVSALKARNVWLLNKTVLSVRCVVSLSVIFGYLVFLLYLAVFCGLSCCEIDENLLLYQMIFDYAVIFFIAFDSKLYGIRTNQKIKKKTQKKRLIAGYIKVKHICKAREDAWNNRMKSFWVCKPGEIQPIENNSSRPTITQHKSGFNHT